MYTLLNNQEAAKFDLYLPGRLVASLHYRVDEDDVMFVYCEAVDKSDVDVHCRELMRRSLENVRARRLHVNVTCPIALKYLEENAS